MGGLAKKLLGTGKQEKLYVDDVFSTYLYTGNNSTQTIINGIDLAGEGGLVWLKSRSGNSNHWLVDSERSVANGLYITTAAQVSYPLGVTSFNPDGFGLGSDPGNFINRTGFSYTSWTFRRAPKFFDVVTYTGNGASNRQIAHELGIAPGFITTKATSTTGDWNTYHRSATGDLVLNSTAAQTGSRAVITAAGSSTFTVSGVANTNGVTYVAYLFAHDDSEDGIIQCGSFTTDAGGNATVDLGWEIQWLLTKTTSIADNWGLEDVARGASETSYGLLFANLSNTENAGSHTALHDIPTATGFRASGRSTNTTYAYVAIRRPNKPPKTGAEVFGVNSNISGIIGEVGGLSFPKDAMLFFGGKSSPVAPAWIMYDRMRGFPQSGFPAISTTRTSQEEVRYASPRLFFNSGNYTPDPAGDNILYRFRRSPGFFDVVCDAGTGVAHTVAHNLTVAPELVIRKSRSATTQWEVWHSALAANEKLVLNSNAAKATDATAWNSTLPGASSLTVGTGANVNANGATFVTYLFATLAGISKVGSYVGNGGSQTIDCGFTTGARFFLVKAVNAAGAWWVYDSARGIVAAADPALQLNSTAAEITSADAVDPHASGIIVNQEATCSINASGVTYAFLAIA